MRGLRGLGFRQIDADDGGQFRRRRLLALEALGMREVGRLQTDRDKVRKDLHQAAVLTAALEEEMPGRIGQLFRAMLDSGKSAVQQGARAAAMLLHATHAEAESVLQRIASRNRP